MARIFGGAHDGEEFEVLFGNPQLILAIPNQRVPWPLGIEDPLPIACYALVGVSGGVAEYRPVRESTKSS